MIISFTKLLLFSLAFAFIFGSAIKLKREAREVREIDQWLDHVSSRKYAEANIVKVPCKRNMVRISGRCRRTFRRL